MPNRCENIVEIRTKKPEDIQEILSAIKGEGLFQHFIPRDDEVRKDRDLELLYGGNGTSWRKEHNIPDGGLSWKEAGYSQCPYKQLWYNWQCNNWGAKRDFRETDYNNCEYEEGSCYIELFYDSPRSPHLVGREKISEKLKCEVHLQFSEPGCCFSGEYTWIDGDEVQSADYDDAYYGNGKHCSICHCAYDNESDDDWYDEHHTICYQCGDDLDRNKKSHDND